MTTIVSDTGIDAPAMTLREQLAAYAAVAWEPDDYIEVRHVTQGIKDGRHIHCLASELPNYADELVRLNRQGRNIWAGICPRNKPKGTTSDDVDLSRVLFADFDHTTVDDARNRWDAAGLPAPSMTINSGHGAHLFLRLAEPIDVQQFRVLQIRLAKKVGSDELKDAARVLRLPGLLNQKPPTCPAMMIDFDPALRYELADLHTILPDDGIASSNPATVTRPFNPPAGAPADDRQTEKKRRKGDLGALIQAVAYVRRIDGSKILPGNRDATLHKTACFLVRDLALDDAEARPLLVRLNESFPNPHPESVIDKNLETARRYARNAPGCKLPASSCEVPDEPDVDRVEVDDEDDVPATVSGETFPRGHRAMLTELGNAERLAYRHGKDIRHSEALGWLVWDGVRWKRDDDREIVRRMIDTARSIWREAAAEHDADRAKLIGKHAATSQSKHQIEAAINLARALPGVAVKPDAFDADPMLLNVANGVIDLKTGALRPHRREDMMTRFAPVAFDPRAACPTFDRFMMRIIPDSDTRLFIQRAVGYTLTGDVMERCLFIGWGGGNNGKSTFINCLRDMLGDYAMQTPIETLMQRKGDAGIPNDVARLAGARMVAASEGEDGQRLAESKIKHLTGGTDAIPARYLHREFFEFVPRFKLWLGTNHKPIITGTDDAIWNRIRLIPFTERIPDAEIDRNLPDKLRAELSGVLRWAVQGCLMWKGCGLAPPTNVKSATEEYRTGSDLMGTFIAECCIEGDNLREVARTLYEGYTAHCKASGVSYLSEVMFARKLKERDFKRDKTASGALWYGLALTDAAKCEVEAERTRRRAMQSVFGDK